MSNVSRSVYQKLAEENKKLLHDIYILTMDKYSLTGERILCGIKWREKFKKDEELIKLLSDHAKQYLKDNPEFDITKNHSGKLDSNPKAFQ